MTSTEVAAVKAKGNILIVDDELVVRDSLGKWFTTEGYHAHTVCSAREALAALQKDDYDLVLLDIKMPGMDGMELQKRLGEIDPDLLVIIMTGYASVETAVQALKRGAYDYITKPFDPDELVHLVSKALEHRGTKREVARLRENLQEIFPRTELIGQSPAMKRVYELVEMVAPTDATVLIPGRAAPARNSWPAPSTPPVLAATARWWSSTAGPSRKPCWRANSSATSAGPSPGRSTARRVSSR